MKLPTDTFEERSAPIDAAAADWATRVDLRGTPEDWAALDAWLALSPRHRAAYLRIARTWKRAEGLKTLAPSEYGVRADLLDPLRRKSGIPADELPVKRSFRVAATGNPLPTKRRLFKSLVGSRLAASIALLAIAGAVAFSVWCGMEPNGVEVYSTDVGEFRRVSLNDGSTVALNTDSKMRVRYTNGTRHIDLERGEALFEVAKNASRPFDVEAGHTVVRAVGTAFSVRLRETEGESRVDVVVSEGQIAINPPSRSSYAAGTAATIKNGRVAIKMLSSEEIAARLSWTSGRLQFSGEALSDIVAELNRYNERKLRIADPAIAGFRLGGAYQATDPDGFAAQLGAFHIKVHPVTHVFGDDVIWLESSEPGQQTGRE